jgi:PAS domain S-box-containing protein
MTLVRRFLDALTSEQLVERLDLALNGANLGIWDWDLRDNSVQFDRRWCEMLGLPHETTAMVLDTWSSRVHPDDLDSCYRDIQAHLEGTTPHYENIHRMRHADGSWHYILDRGRISGRDEGNTPIRFTGTHLDVTELETARGRARLEEQARLETLSNFAATLAHELNTPLQTIALSAHALDQLVVSAEQQSLRDDAVHAIRQMASDAGRITAALRILAATSDDSAPWCRIGEVLRRAQDLFQSRYAGEGIDLRIVDESGDATAHVSTGDALRAVVILLDAALRAVLVVPSGPRSVVLRAICDRGDIEVQCIDTGVPWRSPGTEVVDGGLAGLVPEELLQLFVTRFGGSVLRMPGMIANAFALRMPRPGHMAL